RNTLLQRATVRGERGGYEPHPRVTGELCCDGDGVASTIRNPHAATAGPGYNAPAGRREATCDILAHVIVCVDHHACTRARVVADTPRGRRAALRSCDDVVTSGERYPPNGCGPSPRQPYDVRGI